MRRVLLVAVTLGWLLALVPPANAGGGEFCQPIGEPTTELTVLVTDSCFTQKTLRVPAGSVVTWRQLATRAAHTVTSDDGMFDSGDLRGPFTVRFDAPGTFGYTCIYHGFNGGGMAGRVIVTGEPAGDGPEAVALVPASDVGAEVAGGGSPEPVVPVVSADSSPVASMRATLSGGTVFALVIGPVAVFLALAFLLRRGRA